jgi:hypothetical protein
MRRSAGFFCLTLLAFGSLRAAFGGLRGRSKIAW